MMHKSITFILLAIFISINSFSQIVYIDNDSPKPPKKKYNANNDYTSRYYSLDSKNASKYNIKEKQIVDIYKKGKKWKLHRISTTKFDTTGFEIGSRLFYKGKEWQFFSKKYNANQQVVERKKRYKSKPIYNYVYTYNEKGLLVNKKSFKKGEVVRHSFAEYNDTLIISQYAYDKDSSKLSYQFNYFYYPNGDKKTTEYFRKGKLKKVWSYTCDEEGKEIKPKENKTETTKVCELKQYNSDSTYVIINRLMNEEGKFSKHRKTYDKDDKLIGVEHINLKGKTTYKSIYKRNKLGKIVQQIRYHTGKYVDQIYWQFDVSFLNDSILLKVEDKWYHKKTGELTSSHIREYDKEKHLIKSTDYDKNNKPRSVRKYEYNQDGQTIKSEHYGKGGELLHKYEYEYNVIGLIEEVSTFDQNNELIKVSQTRYQYY